MGFYLHVEVDSPLSPAEYREQVLVPLALALEREQLGRILDNLPEDERGLAGHYELALEVTDQERARAIVQAVLKGMTG